LGTACQLFGAALLLTCAGAPARAASDAEEPPAPRLRSPTSVPRTYPVTRIAGVLRAPSGFGVDLSIEPFDGLEIGGQVASWLLVSEASAYARTVVLRSETSDLTAGVRLSGVTSVLGDDEQNPRHWFASIEAGYEHRWGSMLFGAEVGNAFIRDGAFCPCVAVTGEARIGYLW
jgi:hypothetical protein